MNEMRSRNLDAVIGAAAAPPLEEEQDERVLADVLAMFNAAGAAGRAGIGVTEPITALSPVSPAEQPHPRTGLRTRRAGLIVKCAAVFAICAGTGIAAASAGILPSPVQSFVHHVFGGIGVPGPSPDGTPGIQQSASAAPSTRLGTGPESSASSSASGFTGSSGATSTPAPSSSPSAAEASLVTLCGEVQGSGNSWKTTMDAQDQARLIAAAGGENKVHSYCAHLLNPAGGTTAKPSSGGSGSTNAPTPSPSSTGKNGKGKANGNNATSTVSTTGASAKKK